MRIVGAGCPAGVRWDLLRSRSRAPPLPTPESVFGFAPGADYKLATYDQSIDYFKKLAAASKYMKLVEAGKTTQGRTMYFALISSPENLAKIDRYREIARRLAHPAGPDRRRGAAAGARGQGVRAHRRRPARDRSRRAAAHAAARLRPAQQGERAGDQGDARQRHPDAVADDQSRRPADGRRLVHEERRHAVRAVGPAAALSGIRRPRQQPRRLHAEHDRVARASSTRGGSGSRRSSTCTTSRARSRRASGCRRSPSRSASTRRT